GDRAPLCRRLRAGRRARAHRRRFARDAAGAPDRVIDAEPGGGHPAPDRPRDQRHRVLCGRVRARAWVLRCRPRTREDPFDRLGATCPGGFADVSPAAPRGLGVRSAMTESTERDRIALPAPTVWPMVVALGVTLGFGGLVTHLVVSVVGVVLALVGGVGWWRC